MQADTCLCLWLFRVLFFSHLLPLCIIYVCCCHFPVRMSFCLTGALLILFDLILGSAQLTVNSNAIIYPTHLHCIADRLKNLPTDCAAQLFECGRINKAAYFVARLCGKIYC